MRPHSGGGSPGPAALLFVLAPAVLFAAAAPLAAAPAPPQETGEREERPEIDPYTEGDPEAMEEAGYYSFGPFLWASDHTTERVEETLGGIPLIWVETEHFKIGSSLEPYKVGDDRIEKKLLREELKRLGKRLPRVKSKTKELDPWLRLHLFAQRLEELYERFTEHFEIEDVEPTKTSATAVGASRGKLYPGLKDKLAVLLLEKRSAMARYTSTFTGRTVDSSFRYHFADSDTMFYGIAYENLVGGYRTDAALHYAVAFGVVQNLTNALGGYTHEGPLWWRHGVARWFAREIDSRWLFYTGDEGTAVRPEEDSVWEPKVKARVKHGVFPTTLEMFQWEDFRPLAFSDHMILWSRTDYILRRDEETGGKVLRAMAQPVSWNVQDRDAVIQAQFKKALVDATGMEPEAFDEAWCEWVEKNYSSR